MTKGLKQLDIDELYYLSAKIDENPDKIAGLLFPDKPSGRVTLTKKIGQWAINQTVVLENDQNNKPDVANIFNKVGDRIWHQLPSYAQRVTIKVF